MIKCRIHRIDRLNVSKASEFLGVCRKTLYQWEKKGILKPEYINPHNGYRYYGKKQLKNFKGPINMNTLEIIKLLSSFKRHVININHRLEELEKESRHARDKISLLTSEIYALKSECLDIDRLISEN